MSRKFLDKVIELREKSPIIFAADLLSIEKIDKILACILKYVGGVKIGLPLVLSCGLKGVESLVRKYSDELIFIADLKLADIGFINRVNAEILFKSGFDALIIHAFIGMDGIIPVVELAEKMGKGVFSLCAMSHKGGEEILNKNFKKLVEISFESGVDGLVLPATYPGYIRYVRRIDENILIMSPGVGFQGASIGSALKAGADFEIIGRMIYLSEDPCIIAGKILEKMKKDG